MTKNVQLILNAGLLAGVLDALAACGNYYLSTGKNPVRVFQYIASAVFGPTAFSGGWGMGLVGILFHLLIAIGFAALFVLLLPILKKITRNALIIGVVYGLLVWAIMNLLVVPSTRAATPPFKLQGVLTGVLILITMVGIPISLIFSRYYRNERKSIPS